jgi:thiamine-phosphate diphosphorylase
VTPLPPLPRLLVLTDRHRCGPGIGLIELMAGAVGGGARAIVLREKDRPAAERTEVARHLLGLLEPVGGNLLVASDPHIPAHGVHLAAGDAFPIASAGAGGRPRWVGRSCHTVAEARAAAGEGCDYITISPVFPTASKPGYGPPLGLAGLAAVCDAVDLPVYALAGIDAGNAAACVGAGAAGVAVMGGISGEPAAAGSCVAALLDALGAGATEAGTTAGTTMGTTAGTTTGVGST